MSMKLLKNVSNIEKSENIQFYLRKCILHYYKCIDSFSVLDLKKVTIQKKRGRNIYSSRQLISFKKVILYSCELM